MAWFRNMTLYTKMMCVLALLAAVAFGVGWQGKRGLDAAGEALERIHGEQIASLAQLEKVSETYAVDIMDAAHKARNGNLSLAEAHAGVVAAKQQIDRAWQEYTARPKDGRERVLVDEVSGIKAGADAVTAALVDILARGDRESLDRLVLERLYPAIDPLTGRVAELIELQVEGAGEVLAGTQAMTAEVARMNLFIALAGVLVAAALAVWQLEGMRRRLSACRESILALASGRINRIEHDGRDDEVGGLTGALGNLLAAEAERSAHRTRIASALEAVQTNVMIADAEGRIIHANPAVLAMLRSAESDLRQALPDFRADAVVGSSMDIFHKNPAHQQRMLAALKSTHKAEVTIAGRSFSLIVNPVTDTDGTRLGAVVEWQDLTEEKARTAREQALRAEFDARAGALGSVQAVIEFEPDGTIVTANEIFLQAMGYSLEEVAGKHHRMFVTPEYAASADYREFWLRLARGEEQRGEFHRLARGGRDVWIDAAYRALRDAEGKVRRVIKVAVDVTERHLEAQRITEERARFLGKLDAIDRNMGVLETTLDGTLLRVNDIYLRTMGFSAAEVEGRHHRIFVDAETAASPAYADLWVRLSRGEAVEGTSKRTTKDGRSVWWQATYTPVLDASGKPQAVVIYASDITNQQSKAEELAHVLKETQQVMSGLSSGALEVTMDGQYSSEYADLQQAVNGCVENLRSMVAQIRAASGSIVTGAQEIAQGNADLSQRTEQQASSLEETASSMEELTSTVKQNADNARQADQLAAAAREQAERGGSVVSAAVGAMGAIEESSRRIAEIIGVIDEIAFQTNLLALNAAVEAARAGEQGRGFAVVASEVRNLAQRSAAAAREIKSLIGDSSAKVNEGSRLVDESGQTLNQIVLSVKKVSDIIGEIAAASNEQSAGIEQVNRAITQMDQATQQNAALVEEAAAASESMEEQARKLARLVDFFKTANSAAEETLVSAGMPADRRSGSRPWSGRPTAEREAPRKGGTPPRLDRAVGEDWEEF